MVPLISIRITLKNYNIEKNLGIIYENRISVLSEYEKILSTIEQEEAKNKIRLEIIKIIFTDPHTGFIQSNESTNVSMNPIVNLTDYVKKAGL